MNQLTPYAFISLSLIMGIIVITFPYVITLFGHFNKDRVLIWRKFFISTFVCYVPVVIILYAVYIASPTRINQENVLRQWWMGYYFIYIILAVFVKKRINLQFGWGKFIISTTAGYLITTSLLVFLFGLYDDPLSCLFDISSINYYSPK